MEGALVKVQWISNLAGCQKHLDCWLKFLFPGTTLTPFPSEFNNRGDLGTSGLVAPRGSWLMAFWGNGISSVDFSE